MSKLEEAKQRYRNRQKNKESEKDSKTNTVQKSKLESAIQRYKAKSLGLDTLESDLNSLGATVNNIYGNWQDEGTMLSTKSQVQAMYNRLNQFQEYSKIYGGGSVDVTKTINSYKTVLDGWDELSKKYGKYKSADEYTKAFEKAQADAKTLEENNNKDLGLYDTEIADLESKLKIAEDIDSKISYGATTRANAVEVVENNNKYYKELQEYLSQHGYKNLDELKEKVANLRANRKQAERYQSLAGLNAFTDVNLENYDADYEKYIAEGYSIPYEEVGKKTYHSAGKTTTTSTVSNTRAAAMALYEYKNKEKGKTDSDTIVSYQNLDDYRWFEPEEYDRLAYFIAKDKEDGGNRTEEYLDLMTETLRGRKAVSEFESDLEGNTFLELLYSIPAGLDQFGQGMANAFNYDDDYIPLSTTQIKSGLVREDLADDGFKIGDMSIAQIGYDFGTTTANMLPSILTSVAANYFVPGSGAVIGAGLMGASAHGNAYQEMLNLGYDKKQARTYANLVGISEAGLSYAFSGISKLGGKLTGKSINAIANGVDNAIGRFAIKYGGAMLSEGFEEAAQEALAPFFENLALGYAKNDISDIDWGQVAYSGALGALSGGFFEGGTVYNSTFKQNKLAKTTGAQVRTNNSISGVLDAASLTSQESDAYNLYTKYASKGINAENISDLQVGRLSELSKADALEILNSKKSTAEQKENAKKVLQDLAAYSQNTSVEKLGKKNIKEVYAQDNGEALIAEALENDENSESYKLAVELQKKVGEGKKLTTDEITKLVDANQSAYKGDVTTEAKTKLSEYGEKTAVDNIAEIIAKKSTGEMLSSTEADILESSEYGNLVYNEINNEELVGYAENMDKAERNLFVSLYDGKTSVDRYAAQYNLIKGYAKNRFSVDYTLEHRGVISTKGVKAIYKTFATDKDSAHQNVIEELKQKYKDSPFIYGTFDDSVIDYENKGTKGKVNYDSLTSSQRNAITIVGGVAQEAGMDVELIIDGEERGINGAYSISGNKILIDVYAGMEKVDLTNLKHLIFPTVAHEMTHWMKAKSPVIYQKYGDYVIESIKQATGMTEGEILQRRRLMLEAKHPGEKFTDDQVRDEVIARASEDMFGQSKEISKFLESNTLTESEKKTFVEKVKEFFLQIKEWFENYIKKNVSNAPEVQDIRKVPERIDKQIELWDKMLVDSIEANQALKKEGITGESLANIAGPDLQFNERLVKTHIDMLQKNYSEESALSLDTILARYDGVVEMWHELGGELNSKFLEDWNNKVGKDRTFSVFKAQAGYKYNVELSSMCKKGVPLFEAIDTIVKQEVMNQLKTKNLGKAEKEILYDILSSKGFEIPCAICYVEQARQNEGKIIDAFLNGYVEKSPKGKIIQFKLGWNETLANVQAEMKAAGCDYTFPSLDRSVATDNYTPTDITMDEETQGYFYEALKNVANKEIRRYNKEQNKGAPKKLITKTDAKSISEVFKGKLPLNLMMFKTMFEEPSSRFIIDKDLLYSSMTTQNLASNHQRLYSVFNAQGGVGGYKTKQGTIVYWADILGKKWTPSKLRDEGGVRNQSNSDFLMYTMLDHAQMYIDFTAKGYYLQAYTKVLAELKLFGLSKGKINASFIPKVVEFRKADGTVDIEKTRENAGLDENGNPIYDDIEGINHQETFMLLEDAEYSKNICGVCIGYSDNHILKLLDDKRIQQIIGFHDKTNDPDKRYRGAKYSKNYNGLNEATKYDKDGTLKTVHIGFNRFVKNAENKFKNGKTSIEYKGKTYTYNDIPKLATDLYLEHCESKGLFPAYSQGGVDFSKHPNYYKLLADFGLYDSQGNYAPHQKVEYNMPEQVPYLNENGNKAYMSTKEYVKKELGKELAVRDDISAKLADTSEDGIIPQFIERANALYDKQNDMQFAGRDDANVFNEYSIQAALWEAFDHHDMGNDNLIKVSKMPRYIVDKFGIDGELYIYRNHAYENMVSEEQAIADGRPTKRSGEKIHFHNLGVERMTKALLSINTPTLALSTKSKDGNPTVIMVLDQFGDNGAPLYAVLGFYSNQGINGKHDVKPHIVLTISERSYFQEGGRTGYNEIIRNAIKEGRVLDFNIKKRDDLSVIAESAGLGNITKSSLEKSLSQFLKEIKSFREKNKIQYADRDLAPTFYSQMGKVIGDIKQAKIGADSVVNYLKGKGVKNEEIKWSGVETFLEGKKSVSKAELQEFVAGSMLRIEENTFGKDTFKDFYEAMSDASNVHITRQQFAKNIQESDGGYNKIAQLLEWTSVSEEKKQDVLAKYKIAIENFGNGEVAKWGDYKLDGGSNYREIVFKMPNSSYTNYAMEAHWGKDTKGVLAHARIQDFDVNGKKMLFIEEIQSDWHNMGHKVGYKSDVTSNEVEKLKEIESQISAVEDEMDAVEKERDAFLERYWAENLSELEYNRESKKWQEREYDLRQKQQDLYRERNEYKVKVDNAAPDAPFKDNYHEYVLKRLIRMAAEQGYDLIGWTTADIQSQRWSDEYAKGYRIEYDQDIPKFLNKYGKKWGATVGKIDIQTKKLSMEEEMDNALLEDWIIDEEAGETEESVAEQMRKWKGLTAVWSMDITDSMKNSVLYEGQAMYSDRDKVSVYETMGDTERIIKENAKLKEDVERLKERLKLERQVTHGNYFNQNQLDAVAGHIRNIANSNYAKKDLVTLLNGVYSYIAHSEDLNWQDLFAQCYDVASLVLDESKPATVTNDYFKLILNDIRGTTISLNNAQMQEAKNRFGSKWRNNFFGKIKIADGATSLDRQWQSWASAYPNLFDANISDANMLVELYNIYDSVKESSETYVEYDVEEQTRWLAREIYNQYWNVSPIRTTADKYDKQIKRLNFEHKTTMKELRDSYEERLTTQKKLDKARYMEIIRDVRERKDKEIANIKQKSKERMDAYKENAERKTKIQSITANSLTLSKWLLKNSKEEHIHESLKGPVANLLKAIDFSSKRLLDKNVPTQKDVSLSKALGQVKDMLMDASVGKEELVALYGADLNEDIASLVDSVDNIMRTVGDNEFVLNKMTLEELHTLDMIVKTIKHAVTQMNKFHTVNHAKGIANLSQEEIIYADKLGKAKVFDPSTLKGKMKKLISWGNALPYHAFKRFGNAGTKIFEAFQDGWDKFAFNVKEIIDFTNNTYESKEVQEWDKEIKTFEINVVGTSEKQTIQMTVSQIMSLYCSQKREQARNHMLGGGIRVADIQGKKGEVISQPEGAILTIKDIEKIIDTLTDRQIEVANKLQKFMNTVCSDWGNDVSMARFGYKAFGEDNYFPIQSDKNNLAVDDETEKNNSLFKLLNMSFTKSLNANANNRIVISGIFDVFAQHTSDMAKYNALALPVLDAFRWYNYTEKGKRGETQFITKSVKQSIENAFGKDGKDYITTFLKDINGEQEVSRDTIGKGFFTKAKIASVGLNLRVIFLQPTSYVRANAVIDNKYLTKALFHKPKISKAEQYCGMALWKSMGYYDTNIQRGVADQIKHNETFKDKAVEFSMKGAELADKLTWGYLWNACELEIREKRKDLKVGSEEFYIEIGKRLREVIYSTQVVDSTMTRSQMMRSSNFYDKMLTAFASEPTLAYSMVQDAFITAKLEKRANGKVSKESAKKIGKVMVAYTITNAVAALVESGFDAFRDDDDEEMELEDFMLAYLKNFAIDMSITNKIPYIKEITSIAQGFTSSRTDTQWMESIVNALKGWMKIANGEGNPTSAIKNSLQALSYISGLPFYNSYRDFMATLDKLDILTAEELKEWLDDLFD